MFAKSDTLKLGSKFCHPDSNLLVVSAGDSVSDAHPHLQKMQTKH